METEFVPVAIHNNKGGEDERILERFEEPSWNNPVMRFVDAGGTDVIPRKDRVWDTHGVAERMLAALTAAKKPVPAYLELAELEARTKGIETTTFAMPCFWEGESRLGALAGVTATRAGWLDGREVIEVQFDPKTLAYTELLAQARKFNCLSHAYVTSKQQLSQAQTVLGGSKVKQVTERAKDAKASDQLYYLKRSPLHKLTLSPLQKTRVNAALRLGKSGTEWLSPKQKLAADQL
ncbi:MAG: hypothetical protein ACI87A_002072 [Planctomycetota bacterium]|jgi:hypothetical protein